MHLSDTFALPIKNPVLIFFIILLVILVIPLVSKRLSIPGIVGMIISGIILGPHGLNLLGRDSSVELLSTVGLLYLMFIAGLEIDIEEFKRSRNKSLILGFAAFLIPMLIGFWGARVILKLEPLSAVLLASMFASHTLLAYPLASKLGISQYEPVTVAVGSTIITDIMALLTLAVIIGLKQGEMNTLAWIKLITAFAVFAAAIFMGLPRLTVWFFRNLESDGEQQFIFVLSALFFSAFFAQLAGLEPIIGAFFAGLAINRYVPSTSPLMNRIQFVGNAIFIPFFLISVGMLVDIRVLYSNIESWIVAITMTTISLSSKWIAAFSVQKIFKYSSLERNLIFGLNSAQAAATLAIVLIALRAGIFGNNILNGTIFMILVTCVVSSFIVEREGRKLAVHEEQKSARQEGIPEKILLPISKEESIELLVDFANMIKEDSSSHLYALTVVRNIHGSDEQITRNNKVLSKAVTHAAATEQSLQIISRIDLNVASGILRAIRELLITDVVIEWTGNLGAGNKIFGNILDQLLQGSNKAFYVCRITCPVNTIRRMIIVMPDYAEYERGFTKWVSKIRLLSKETGAKILCFGSEDTLEAIRTFFDAGKPAVEAEFRQYNKLVDLNLKKSGVCSDDLFVLVSSRSKRISWNRKLDEFPRRFVREYPSVSFVVVYPEQI
ncbi:MAG: cation:proton antiporter [Ignavibacteriales bacterium]